MLIKILLGIGLMITLVIMAFCKAASNYSREEEKYLSFCENDCYKCTEWDWCPVSDRRNN